MIIEHQLSNLGIPALHDGAFQPHTGCTRLYSEGCGDALAPDPQVWQVRLEQMQLGRDWLAFTRSIVQPADLDALTDHEEGTSVPNEIGAANNACSAGSAEAVANTNTEI